MLAKIYSAAVHGIEAFVVTIETVVDKGTLFTIVGLPDTAVKESYTRIVSAIKESGVTYPHRRITINLAPADVKKRGPASTCRWRSAYWRPTKTYRTRNWHHT